MNTKYLEPDEVGIYERAIYGSTVRPCHVLLILKRLAKARAKLTKFKLASPKITRKDFIALAGDAVNRAYASLEANVDAKDRTTDDYRIASTNALNYLYSQYPNRKHLTLDELRSIKYLARAKT